jgi:hypothetical protein
MRRNRQNLNKISELCEYLSDRDIRLKEEHFLFKKIIEDLPLKVFAIKVDKEMNIISQLGTNVPNISGKNIIELFEKESDYVASCIMAMEGSNSKSTISFDGSAFECINKPVKTEDGIVNSIISVAWSRS